MTNETATPYDAYLTHVREEGHDYCDTCEEFEGRVWFEETEVWDSFSDDSNDGARMEFSEWALHATQIEILEVAQQRHREALAS